MGKYKEITGVPCSGKSYYVKAHDLKVAEVDFFKSILVSLINIPFNKLYCLSLMCFKEKVSWFYKIKLFFLILKKIGVYHLLKDKDVIIDEGVSHIFYNLLESSSESIMYLIEDYLPFIDVKFVNAPSDSVLIERYKCRGHKRLEFYDVNAFILLNEKAKLKQIQSLKCRTKTFEEISLC